MTAQVALGTSFAPFAIESTSQPKLARSVVKSGWTPSNDLGGEGAVREAAHESVATMTSEVGFLAAGGWRCPSAVG